MKLIDYRLYKNYNQKKWKTIKNEGLFTKCGWSPFNKWKLKGTVKTTIVGGNIVFQEGNVMNIKAREVTFQ